MEQTKKPYYLNYPVPVRKYVLTALGFLGFLSGLVATLVVGFQLWAEVQRAEAQQQAVHAKPLPEPETSGQSFQEKEHEESVFVWKRRPHAGEKSGILIIPRIGAKIPIWEGTGDRELERGVGHHRRSVLPGEPDDSVLAGHRETAFRHAKKIQVGDEIQVKTDDYTFTFEVTKKWVADADDPSVVASNNKGESRLITYTCWPVEAVYSGYAPQRYVIESDLIRMEKH